MSCQWDAEESYMTDCCNNGGVVSSDRLYRSASTCKSENKRKICWPALRQKKVPASSTWWHFFEVQQLLALWFSSTIQIMQKITFNKFDQWRVRRWMWSSTNSVSRSTCSHTKFRREGFAPQRPVMTPGSVLKTADGRSIYMCISWQKVYSTRICGARLRLAQIKKTYIHIPSTSCVCLLRWKREREVVHSSYKYSKHIYFCIKVLSVDLFPLLGFDQQTASWKVVQLCRCRSKSREKQEQTHH